MRKLIYMTSMSLDGYIEAARGDSRWMMPDEELHRHFNDVESTVDTQLYGRRMYELMTQFWPTADQNPSPPYIVEYARLWKSVAKVVFSTTLQQVAWNARLVKGDPLAEVANLKAQRGGNLSIGGTVLASALADGGLIDEYRLYIVPIILGGGVPIFSAVRERINLKFAEARTFTSGTVLIRYVHEPPSPQRVRDAHYTKASLPHRASGFEACLEVAENPIPEGPIGRTDAAPKKPP